VSHTGSTSKSPPLREALIAHGQAHLVAQLEKLDDADRSTLTGQLDRIDLDKLDQWVQTYVRDPSSPRFADDLVPAPYYPAPTGDGQPGSYDSQAFRRSGEDLISNGRVAAFTVAGGQGTRLGWNGPKGTYPGTAVTGMPLFRIFAEQILATQQRYDVTIPWYIMTSPLNDEQTRRFFQDNNCFGLPRNTIFMFPQGVMPSLDAATGQLLLSDRCTLAVNPDGHGGSLKALRASGALEDMQGRGIEHISYFQVDNPLVRVIDPLFIGLHATAPDSSGQMSSKMVRKTDPAEKVGVFCRSASKTIVVEYTDLPPALAEQRAGDGALHFDAGSIAIHMIGVGLVQAMAQDPDRYGLEFHRALKKVPYLDVESGQMVEPAEPNAVKLETFVFDALPLAESSIVMETHRQDEFAPIKNAQGVDSPASSHRLQSDRAARWLEAQGVNVPRDEQGEVMVDIEISPLTALEAGDLAGADLPNSIAPGEQMVL
jgi:UDP-N-acetylglucosamine/UDP-N-acetylgalactosamine diphosphorylase